jgi:hypothetical protein
LNHYCLGTLFTRSLVATYLAQGHAIADEGARQEFSRGVVAALRGTVGRMRGIGLPPPTPEVAQCNGRHQVSTQLDPPLIGAFLETLSNPPHVLRHPLRERDGLRRHVRALRLRELVGLAKGWTPLTSDPRQSAAIGARFERRR